MHRHPMPGQRLQSAVSGYHHRRWHYTLPSYPNCHCNLERLPVPSTLPRHRPDPASHRCSQGSWHHTGRRRRHGVGPGLPASSAGGRARSPVAPATRAVHATRIRVAVPTLHRTVARGAAGTTTGRRRRHGVGPGLPASSAGGRARSPVAPATRAVYHRWRWWR